MTWVLVVEEEVENGPTREEIETLCILHVVGRAGCKLDELPHLLGLSTALAEAVANCIEPLIGNGLLVLEDGGVKHTEAGSSYLTDRLALWLGTRARAALG